MKIKTLLLALSAAGLLAGCANNVNTVQRAQPEARPNYVSDQRIITDSTLGSALKIVSVNQTTVSGNLLKVQVTLENAKSSARSFNYRFEWVDADGMAVSSPGNSWKIIQLKGRETSTVSAVAVSPRVVDFVLKLQEP